MMTTALLIGTVTVLLLALLGFNAIFLLLGSRWAKIPNVTYPRALGATVAANAANCVGWFVAIMLERIPVSILWQSLLIMAMGIIVNLGLMWLAIALVFKVSVWRAALVWLLALIPTLGFALLTAFGFRFYLFEAFKIPTNSMAPTILGVHWETPCPRCGSPAYASAEPGPLAPDRPVLMICSQELRSCEVINPQHAELPGDRIVVNKLIRPKRWDVIVFRYPEEPGVNYCKRLVGLPGETVVIRDGAAWINGEKQSPPDSCAGLEYLARLDDWHGTLWGSETKPARLGPDEYFVLGDFSARAKDSRLWQHGAPGHPPYAVPASYIIGVVTHIYWPLSRWRVLR